MLRIAFIAQSFQNSNAFFLHDGHSSRTSTIRFTPFQLSTFGGRSRTKKQGLRTNGSSNSTLNIPSSSFSNTATAVATAITSSRTRNYGNSAFHPQNVEIASRSQVFEDDIEDSDVMLTTFEEDNSYPFVGMLRNSANYIANHRHTTAVYHIPGDLLEWDGFTALLEDIALTWLLGMKIVIVVGCRRQVNARNSINDESNMSHNNSNNEQTQPTMMDALRPTDLNMLRIVEEEAGFVRFEVERQLNRCLKLHGGADLRVPGAMNSNVVSGNFYVAEPVGYENGIDYGYTGFPSHVNSKKIRSVYEETNDVVLLTSCSMSRSGEPMYVKSESLAAHVSAAINASKVIYCSSTSMVLRNKETGRPLQNFRLQDAKNLLDYHHVDIDRHFVPRISLLDNGDDDESSNGFKPMSQAELEFLLQIGYASIALEHGVERAHIIAPSDGALITELFTAKDGSGTCISQDEVVGIHPDENFYGDDDISTGNGMNRNEGSPSKFQ